MLARGRAGDEERAGQVDVDARGPTRRRRAGGPGRRRPRRPRARRRRGGRGLAPRRRRRAATAASSVTSTAPDVQRRPPSSGRRRRRPGRRRRPWRPRSSSRVAVAWPMPDAAPVTTHVLALERSMLHPPDRSCTGSEQHDRELFNRAVATHRRRRPRPASSTPPSAACDRYGLRRVSMADVAAAGRRVPGLRLQLLRRPRALVDAVLERTADRFVGRSEAPSTAAGRWPARWARPPCSSPATGRRR